MKTKRNMLFVLTLAMLTVSATIALGAATPSVDSVNPNIGPLYGNQVVTVTGQGFTNIQNVYFVPIGSASNTSAYTGSNIQVANANSFTVTTPATPIGKYDIVVEATVSGQSVWSVKSENDRYEFVTAPIVRKVSPVSGNISGGTSVTLTGENFNNAAYVWFDGIRTTEFTVDNNNQITVIAPGAPDSYLGVAVPVAVQRYGSSFIGLSYATYTWITAPTVTKINPNSGSVDGGNTVTITGQYFTGTKSVYFGDTKATSFTVVDDNTITAVVPAGTGKVDVQITNEAGASDTSTSKDDYNYVQVPYITSITPTSGSYVGGNTIDILGYGFTGATKVVVGSNEAEIISVTGNKIKITAPALNSQPTKPGAPTTVHIQVTASGGVSVNSDRDKYMYVAVPRIYSLSPSKGPTDGGTVVTVKGIGFTGVSGVWFWNDVGSTPATTYKFISDTEITVTTPQNRDGYAWVVLHSTGGESENAMITPNNVFKYASVPVINSIAPTAGPATGGTVVTITGNNLKEVTTVKFGNNAATAISIKSKTKITAKAPAGTGTVDVIAISPSGTSSTSDDTKFTYQQAVPTITSVSPSSGSMNGGNTVAIYGTGLTGATSVKFGSVSAKISSVSATKIAAIAPYGTPGTVDITVTTPSGTSAETSADQYTYIAAKPYIKKLSPTYGTYKGGNTVTIYGSGFTGATAVKFGTKKATSFKVVNNGKISAKAPSGTRGSTIYVSVTSKYGVSTNSKNCKYTYK
jgi:hypothetical protein